MNNRSTHNGFTLVELLIVLAISGLIMTGIYSAFKSQQNSYLAQEQVAEVQQNLRAALYIMTKEIRMAGYDGDNSTIDSSCNLPATSLPVSPGILTVPLITTPPTTTVNRLDFSMDLNSDGDCADLGENLSYYIQTSPGNLRRLDNNYPPTLDQDQDVAENFTELEFAYLDSSLDPTDILSNIRSIQVSILAETRRPDRNYTDSKTYHTTPAGTDWGPYGDNLRRRFQTMTVRCRNLGL